MHATALGSCACCGHGLGLQGDNRVGQVPAGREHPVPPGFGAIRSFVLSLAACSACRATFPQRAPSASGAPWLSKDARMKSDSRDPMSCVAQNFLPGKDARSAAYQPRKHNFNLNLAKSALNLGRRHCSHRGPHSTAAARIPPRSVPLRGRIWVRSVEPSSIMQVWTRWHRWLFRYWL